MHCRQLGLIALMGMACGKTGAGTDTADITDSEDTEVENDARIEGVLNEFLMINDTVNMDESGEYDDWMEIVNPTEEPLDVSGFGLTDGLADDKEPWVFPDGTVIMPRKLLLIWCDDDPDQGSFHATFKLSSSGETVSLVDTAGDLVDEVVVPSLPADTSWARAQNGQWVEAVPSPETPNP